MIPVELSACPAGLDVEILEVALPPAVRLRMRELGLRVGATVRVLPGPFGGRVLALGPQRMAVDARTAALIRVSTR